MKKELTFDKEGAEAEADADTEADAELSALGCGSSALNPSEMVFPTANPES